MTKKERIQAAIRGEKPDKMPYSFWTHMPGTDLDPEAISQKSSTKNMTSTSSRP